MIPVPRHVYRRLPESGSNDGVPKCRRAAELDPDRKIMFITGFAAVALNSDSNALRELVNEVQKMLAA